LANSHGWTVAHTAAWHGHLPPDFNQWGLMDTDGRTVMYIKVLRNNKHLLENENL
jgi:hypothetical protein